MSSELVVDTPRRDAQKAGGLGLVAVSGIEGGLEQHTLAGTEAAGEAPAVSRQEVAPIRRGPLWMAS